MLLIVVALLSTLLSWPNPSAAQVDEAQFREDLRIIAAKPRIIGSAGYEETAAYLQKQVQALPGVELRRHDFPVMVPVTRSATITLPGGATENIYPFWPAHIRLNATPAEGITGTPVYIGEARFEQIPPAALDGQIAVVEASAAWMWQQAIYFGARAILVVGKDDTNNVDLRAHESTVPLSIPRFYVPPGALADQLRQGRVAGPVTLKAQVNWEKRTAHNFYALVCSPVLAKANALPLPAQWAMESAVNLGPDRWAATTPPAALMLSVPYDSSGLVPDLANGASQAAQTAAGLAMLRDIARRPLSRPVLFFFSGADSIQFLATRNMFMAFADVPTTWRQVMDDLSELETAAQTDLKRLAEIQDDPSTLSISKDRPLITRIAKIIETDAALEQDRLFRLRMGRGAKSEVSQDEAKRLELRQALLNRLRYAFQQRPATLRASSGEGGEDLLPLAREYVQRTLWRLNGQGTPGTSEYKPGLMQQYAQRRQELQDRIDLYRWLAGRLHRDPDPDDRSNNSRLIEMLVALDLSDQGVRLGPLYWGQYLRQSNISHIQDYRDWFNKQKTAFDGKDAQAQWFGKIQQIVDFEPLTGSRAPQSWLCASMPIGSELCAAWGVPGFSLVTLDDLRLRRDTPTDTVDHLKVDAILPQITAVQTLLRKAWDDPKFKGQPELKWQRTSFAGQVVSPAPGRPVPDLPREGFLVTYYYVWGAKKVPSLRWMPWTMGVRRDEVHDCDAEGNYRFEGMPRVGDQQMLCVQVYQMQPDSGTITACSDLGKQAGAISPFANIQWDLNPIRSLPFNCTEFTMAGLYDPRFLQDLGEVLPLDARRNAEPQRFNLLIQRQLLAGFLEPDLTAYLVFRYGRVGNRLLLLNSDAPGGLAKLGSDAEDSVVAAGFPVGQLSRLGPLSLVTSRDFYNLDTGRLDKYRKAGVYSSLIDDLHKRAGDQIQEAKQAAKANAGADMVQHANGAWANEARVYLATRDMANDVIRGAIFLLLLCVPFSFCMERLLIGTPNIYKQIGYTAGIFAVMTAALWSFHPAFKISSSPLIIILAFAIIFMSVVVISVVYGKFDTELKRIRSGRGTAPTTSFARASVLMSAVLLGIANMRRRKFRTALTSVTVVLITFAVLCFTSASRYLDTVTLPMGVASSHPGLMLRQRGWRPMPAIVIDNVRAVLGARVAAGEAPVQLVERWWNINAGDPKDQTHIVAASNGNGAPRIFAAQAVLGLSPGESKLSPIAEVIGPEKFARMEKGEQRIIYLSSAIADQLKVKEGQTVKLGGTDLEVAGVFDANEFDQKVMTLSGEPLAPLQYVTGELDSGGRRLDDNALESLDLDPDTTVSEMAQSYEHLSSTQFVIVPAAISRTMPSSSLRSVGLRLADFAQVKAVSDELSKRFAVAMFAGFEDGVKMVAASNLASVSGAGQVAIPLAIAGLIIFNTMMGSIAERRREIHVYTSLGLAPMHVGALFLAEAMTYGLIGTVFGYVIGQGAGTALLKLGWLGNVTLNYSGTSAMMTMGMILLIVLFSSLAPARPGQQDRRSQHRPHLEGAAGQGRSDHRPPPLHHQQDRRHGRLGLPGGVLRRPSGRQHRQILGRQSRGVHLRG